jgi:type I restriction enzyme S subunit
VIADLQPYPAYKDSGVPWLREMPAHWRAMRGRACYREKKVSNVGLQETTVLSLSYGQIVIKPVEKLHGLVPASFETYQIIDPGDIVVRPTDLQNDWNSLRFGLSQHRGIITSAYMCLHTEDVMTREYGHLLLHAYDLKKVFYGLGSGLRQNLDWRDFKYLPCLVPPLPEQAAIVRYLAHVDRRIRRYIRAKQKLIALFNEQKQAIIHQAVTRGLDPNVRLKPSGVAWLGDVPAHWALARLKDVAVVQTGLTLGKNYQGMVTESRPYLRVANVQHGRVDLGHIKYVNVPSGEVFGTTLKAGDVLMTEGGDIDKLGRGCVWRGEIPGCLHQNHIFAVRCRQDALVPEFLVGLMTSQHGRTYFQLTAKQTTNLASTNSTTLRAFPVILPPVAEQRAILDEVARQTSGLDAAMARTENEIFLLREYRTRLIADVVTGKLDVRAAAAALPEAGEEPELLVEAPDEAEEADDPIPEDEETET